MRALTAAALAVVVLLAGCSQIDTSPDKPTFGGGDPSSAAVPDADAQAARSAAAEAGIASCDELTQVDAPSSGKGALPALGLDCLGDGGTVDLARLRGPAVVNLWASWCKPCREELPLLARLHEELGDEVSVVGIDVKDSDPLAAVSLARSSGVTYPQLVDPELRSRAGLRAAGVPWTVFVDAQGRMVGVESRPFTSYAELTAAVREHLEVTP